MRTASSLLPSARFALPRKKWAHLLSGCCADLMELTGLYEAPVARTDTKRVMLSPEAVIGVERTRATYLSYEPVVQSSFDDELRDALAGLDEVSVGIRTHITMARVRNQG